MHFASLLPDWNSLESVRRAHSDLEFLALVFFALLVLFEALAHLTEKESREKLFDKIGVVLFAVAVLAELTAYPYGQRNDTLSGQVIGSLDAKAKMASTNADKALTNSGVALSQAEQAEQRSGTANTSASNALVLARGARTEADSYERDIVSANEKAAKAESDLAESLQRVANAEKEATLANDKLAGWKLNTESQARIASKIKPFSGTHFDLAVNPSEATFMETIDSLLVSPSVGWVRQQPKKDNPLFSLLIDGKASIILVSGVSLELDQDQQRSLGPAVIALGNALRDEGIPVVGHVVTTGSWGDRIHIIIGKRE